jgi:hypothetical protein
MAFIPFFCIVVLTNSLMLGKVILCDNLTRTFSALVNHQHFSQRFHAAQT